MEGKLEKATKTSKRTKQLYAGTLYGKGTQAALSEKILLVFSELFLISPSTSLSSRPSRSYFNYKQLYCLPKSSLRRASVQ